MTMVMQFRLMAGMIVIVVPVDGAVLMIMHMGAGTVRVLVEMFVQMLVSVSMAVFMAVLTLAVDMFVRVRMPMVVRMQMFVFVFPFHNQSSCSSGYRIPSWVSLK
jgi:hypothetical protein